MSLRRCAIVEMAVVSYNMKELVFACVCVCVCVCVCLQLHWRYP